MPASKNLLGLLVLSTWLCFDAGTAGLTRYFRQFHSSAWRNSLPDRHKDSAHHQMADHVCIDMNFILHSCYRIADDPQHVIAKIFSSIDDVLRHVRPLQSLILAFDGPAPFAKLQTQRSRRKSTIKNCLLTPGTDFMNSMENLMLCYSLQRIRYRLKTVNIYVSGPRSPGEGELKIVDWIYTTSPPKNETIVICGCDSDILLQALSLDQFNCSVLQYGSEFEGAICDANILFESILNRTLEYAKDFEQPNFSDDNFFQSNFSDFIETFRKQSSSRFDFLLLYLLQGNDYLPKLRALTIPKAFRIYVKTMMQLPPHQRFLYNASDESFNLNALLLFFRGLGSQGGVALPLQAPGAVQTLHNIFQRRKQELQWTELAVNGSDGVGMWEGKLEILNRVYESTTPFPSKRELRKSLALTALKDIDMEAYDAMLERQAYAKQGLEEIRDVVRKERASSGTEFLDIDDEDDESLEFDSEQEFIVSEEEYINYVRENDAIDYLRGLLWIIKMYRTGKCPDLSYSYAGKPALTAFSLSRCLERAIDVHEMESLESMICTPSNHHYR